MEPGLELVKLADAPAAPAADDKVAFPCPACGAALEFRPGGDLMHCGRCGTTRPISAGGPSMIHEHDFESAVARVRALPSRSYASDSRSVQCSSCGAQTIVTGQAARCPFCSAPVVVDGNDHDAAFHPESLLPFHLDAAQAKEAFDKWLGGLWFAPGNLRSVAGKQALDGVYMPYWTYDSQTTTCYTGSRGEYYYVTTSYTDSQGNRRTRTTRHTRWYPASGTVHVPFDDMLVCASQTMPRSLVEQLEPWHLESLRTFDPAYLSGFVAERYQIGFEDAFKIAEQRMDPEIRAAVRRDIGGDTQRIDTVSVRHADIRFKHLLLPMWLSSFKYDDKIYRFVINARTGEVAGERPWSVLKIFLFVVALLAVGTAIGLWIYHYA